jgi:hypothetical protein
MKKKQTTVVQLMADCMDMVRSDLVEMGIIDKAVAPMFIPEAVANYVNRLRAEFEMDPLPILRDLIVARYGTQAEAARQWRVSPNVVSDVLKGRRAPYLKMLAEAGLKRVLVYRKL